MEVPVTRDSRYLHPSKHVYLHPPSKAINAVGWRAVEVHNSLGNELFRKVFGKAVPKHDFFYVIGKEMKEFQLGEIPDRFFAKDEEGIKSLVSKASY